MLLNSYQMLLEYIMLEYEGVLMVLCAHYAGPDNIRQESPKSLNPKTLNAKP